MGWHYLLQQLSCRVMKTFSHLKPLLLQKEIDRFVDLINCFLIL
ncbi:hypothetical protein Hanom_Chr09g00761011 [Helianthus anomalus]